MTDEELRAAINVTATGAILMTDEELRAAINVTVNGIYVFGGERGVALRRFENGKWYTGGRYEDFYDFNDRLQFALKSRAAFDHALVFERCEMQDITSITLTYDLEGNPIRRARQPVQQELFE